MKRSNRFSPGYMFKPGSESDYGHYVGGKNLLAGGDCPNCQRPLLQYLVIDTSDPRLALQDFGLENLPLLGCGRCALSWYPFSYLLTEPGRVSKLEWHAGEVMREDWSEHLGVDEFERREIELVPVPEDVEDLFDLLNQGQTISAEDELTIASFTESFARPEVGAYPIVDVINQIGGRSFMPQRLEDPDCRKCSGQMSFLASVTNDEKSGFKVAYDGEQIVFFLCAECRCIETLYSI